MVDSISSSSNLNINNNTSFLHRFSDSTEYSPPLITASIIVNVITAVLASTTLAAAAVVADILGYIIYSLAKNLTVRYEDIEYFALISEVGSLIFGALMLMMLASSKLLSYAIIDNNFCAQVSIRMIVFLNFVVNMMLGFLEDHLFDHDKMSALMWPCLWSKIIALSIIAFTGAVLWASGADAYIGKRLSDLYANCYTKIEENVGPSSDFYREGGYKGRLAHCFTHFCKRGSASEQYRPVDMQNNDLESDNVMVTHSPLSPSAASSNESLSMIGR